MNDLQVLVEQNPGVVKWNFEELKTALEAEMKTYETAVYDDTMIKAAKSDVASLRKLKDSVEERRKEIRKKCLEPYGIIEAQAKELTGLIDRPISLIDRRVKEYEEEQKRIRRAEIVKFFEGAFVDIDAAVSTVAKTKKYDPRWENASATKKSWQDAITSLHDTIKSDLALLDDVDEDCREAALLVYKQNLVLSDALMKANEMKRQKEAILEAERRRREEAERRRQEEERRRAESEAAEKARRETEAARNTPYFDHTATENAQAGENMPEQKEAAPEPETAAPVNVQSPQPSEDEKSSGRNVRVDLVITGTGEQIMKIKGFIKYTGASFVERAL